MKSKSVGSLRPKPARPEHPLQWVAEPLLAEETFELKWWFGGCSIMLHGQHQLFLAAKGEPWQGVLVCTSQEHQPSLLAEFSALTPHPILRKWLYLSESTDTFERDAKRLVQRVQARDPRVGILPSAKKKKAARKVRFGDPL